MGWLPVPFLIPDPPHRQNRPGICQQVYEECGREPNTLANRQYLTWDILVDSADREAPRLVSSQQEKRQVCLYLDDKDSGIDYGGIHAIHEDGTRAEPVSYDPKAGCVVFACPDTTMTVYIPDMAGNRLQLIISAEQ